MAEAKHAEAVRIGTLIKGLRERKGWSQEDLAQKVGASTSTVSRWERGLHKGYRGNIRKLAKVLGVQPSLLTPADELVLSSQLDRIEQMLIELHGFFLGAEDEALAEGIADRLLPEAELPQQPAAGRSRTRPAGSRRKSA
jgi:transcriptional regulator with XRE-family HTH domain